MACSPDLMEPIACATGLGRITKLITTAVVLVHDRFHRYDAHLTLSHRVASIVHYVFFSKLALALVGCVAVQLIFAGIFHAIEDRTFLDSLYFSTVLTFTIGFGDIVPVTRAGRAVTSLFALIGVGMTALLLACFAEAMCRVTTPRLLVVPRLPLYSSYQKIVYVLCSHFSTEERQWLAELLTGDLLEFDLTRRKHRHRTVVHRLHQVVANPDSSATHSRTPKTPNPPPPSRSEPTPRL